MVGGHEVFFLWDVISDTQELSHAIAASVSHLADHNPMLPTTITGLIEDPLLRVDPPFDDVQRPLKLEIELPPSGTDALTGI